MRRGKREREGGKGRKKNIIREGGPGGLAPLVGGKGATPPNKSLRTCLPRGAR